MLRFNALLIHFVLSLYKFFGFVAFVVAFVVAVVVAVVVVLVVLVMVMVVVVVLSCDTQSGCCCFQLPYLYYKNCADLH